MIQTVNGSVINPFKFKADDIKLEELAHALACQNRFFGHARYPISIAQHAVSVSLLAIGHEMQGLHHDDSEAILGDINKWLKQSSCFADYRKIEDDIQTEFYRKFNCPLKMSRVVSMADRIAVRCEMVFAFGPNYPALHPSYGSPDKEELDFFLKVTQFKEMSWKQAEELYLERHFSLSGVAHHA